MARTRSIKPEYFDDEKLAKVSRDSRLTFVGMWTNSDDWGIVKGNHLWLKSQVFPYDNIEPETFTKWVDELQKIGVIIPFDSHGESYYLIVNWSKHQRVDHPSKTFRNPEPPEGIRDGIPESLARPSGDLRDETEVKLKLKQNINRSKTETSGVPPEKNDHQKLINHFCQLYEERYKIKYSFSGGKDGKAIKELLKAFDFEFCIKLIDQLFRSDDKFYDKGGGRTIGVLLANRNKLAQETVQNLDPKSKFSQAAQRTIENIRQVIAERKEISDVTD